MKFFLENSKSVDIGDLVQHRIKLIASASLLTKILADFLFGLYLLNSLLNHATNLIQNRYIELKRELCTRRSVNYIANNTLIKTIHKILI